MATFTKKGLIKSVIGIGSVLGVLIGTKVASAADCHQVMVFKDGLQEYAGPNTSTGVVVRGSATVRVRLYCTNGKQAFVTGSDLPKKQDKPQVSEKKAGIEVVLISAFAEFEGSVSANPGETKNLTFTDSGGTTYTVTVTGKHGLVEQPAIDAVNGRLDNTYTKPESDGRFAPIGASYTKPESDNRYAGKGEAGGPAHIRLYLEPLMRWRPGFDPAGGVQGTFGYRVGNPMETGFLFKLEAGWAMLSSFPTRKVVGVPHTEPYVQLHTFHVAPMFLADIVLGNYVNLDLGGGLAPTIIHYPGTSVGQEANGGSVWGVHPDTQFTLMLQAEAAFKFFVTSPDRKGLFISLGFLPGVELIPTKGVAGGTDKTHKFNLVGALGLGGAIPGT
jgi:hypothetical protein